MRKMRNIKIFIFIFIFSVQLYPASNSALELKHFSGTGLGEYLGLVSSGLQEEFFIGGYVKDINTLQNEAILHYMSYYQNTNTVNYFTTLRDGINEPVDIAVSQNNTVFCAQGENGLSVYKSNNGNLNKITSISDIGNVKSVTALNDETIFVSCGYEGLRVFDFDGMELSCVAWIDSGIQAQGVRIGKDGTVFLCNYGEGLRAYNYNEVQESRLDFIGMIENQTAIKLTILPDSSIAVASGKNGLIVYKFNFPKLIQSTKVIPHVTSQVRDVASTNDGTIFVANGGGGIYVYYYNGNSLNFTCSRDDGGSFGEAVSVDVSINGIIYVAWGMTGYSIYEYNGYVGICHDYLAKHYRLNQNYPNPFNPSTTISYAIPFDSHVKLTIYNISGRLVETLVDEFNPAGVHRVKWDASKYSSGIYISRLESSHGIHSRKMLLIK